MPVYGTGNGAGNRGSRRGPSATQPPKSKPTPTPKDKGTGGKNSGGKNT